MPRADLKDEILLLDVIPDALHSAIRAGVCDVDLAMYIDKALAQARRVIVPVGIYRKSRVSVLRYDAQQLIFEDGSWFENTMPGQTGIAIPHGLKEVSLKNPGLIGCAVARSPDQHSVGILWNANASGERAFGSQRSFDMGGEIRQSRFRGTTPGISGWNTFVYADMTSGLRIYGLQGEGLIGTESGAGYGILASGDNISIDGAVIHGAVAGQGRHAVYLSYCRDYSVSHVTAQGFQNSAIAVNTQWTAGNVGGEITDCDLADACLASVSGSAAVELAYQGEATSGGAKCRIARIRARRIGTSFIYARGYSQVSITDTEVEDYGPRHHEGQPAAHGLHLIDCDDSQIRGHRSATPINNPLFGHMVIQTSARVTISDSQATNSGPFIQRAAVILNTTPNGTPDCRIERVTQALTRGGGWGIPGGFENTSQNRSIFLP